MLQKLQINGITHGANKQFAMLGCYSQSPATSNTYHYTS